MRVRILGVIAQFKAGYIAFDEMQNYLLVCFSELKTAEELFEALGWTKDALDITK